MFAVTKRLGLLCALMLGAVTSGHAIVGRCPQVGFTIVEPHATPETRAVRWGALRIFIHKVPLTTTGDITRIKVVADGPSLDGPDDALIQLTFTPAADQRLHEATSNRSGMRIAFMFGDKVLSNVIWQGPYGMDTGGVQVSLNRGRRNAKQLPEAINGCTARQ